MKVLLILKGLSYLGPTAPAVDFRSSIDSLREKVIDNLRSNGHALDILLSTNPHELLDELKAAFQPIACLTSTQYHDEKTLAALEYILANRTDAYDLIVITRFDAHFVSPLLSLPFDVAAFNFLCYGENTFVHGGTTYNDTDDTLYVLPGDARTVRAYLDVVHQVLAGVCRHNIRPLLADRGVPTHMMYTTCNLNNSHGIARCPYYAFARLLPQFSSPR